MPPTAVGRRRSTPEVWAPLAVVLVLTAYLASRALIIGQGWSTFVNAGSAFADPSAVPEQLLVEPDSTGYDGQFFYRLSLDPLTSSQTDFGITLDQPAYRHQRIFFPLLAFLLNAATGISTLVWLPVLGIAGCALATMAAVSLLRRAGANPWWSIAIGCSPGLMLGTRLDTAEPLAIGLSLAGLAVVARRPWLAAALLSGAVLTRETTLALAAGVGFVALRDTVRNTAGHRRWGGLVAAAMPLVIYVMWQYWLATNWGGSTASDTADRFGFPLVDVLRSLLAVRVLDDLPISGAWLWWTLRMAIAVVLFAAILALRSSSASSQVKAAFIPALIIVLLLPGLITPQQASRASVEAYVLALLILAANKRYAGIAWLGVLAPVLVLVSA